MQVFTRDELEILRLEASRTRIAKVREKLRQMKNMALPRLGRSSSVETVAPGEDGDKPTK